MQYHVLTLILWTGETLDNLPLEAGDDAGMVKWVDISEKLKLYASHSYFVKRVTEKRGAHWSENRGSECHEWCKWRTNEHQGENTFYSFETDNGVLFSDNSAKSNLAKTLGNDK